MHIHSFHALVAIFAGTALSSPSLELPATKDVAVLPLDSRDLSGTRAVSWIKQNEILFDTQIDDDDNNTPNVNIRVDCLDCQASSTIAADFHTEELLDFLDSTLNISFVETSAHIDLDIMINGAGTYAFNIYTSETPVGIAGDDWSLGLVYYLDLVFDLSAEIELQGGFEFTIPDGSFVAVDLHGGIIGQNFLGASVNTIPWQIVHGDATLKADLRLRTELGASFEVAGFGAEAELGVYINLVEIIADVKYDPEAPCTFETTETWDLNIGAIAPVNIIIDSTSFGAAPTASTTFYTGSTWSQCWNSAAATTSSDATIIVDVPTQNILPATTSEDVSIIVGGPPPNTSPATTSEDVTIIVGGPPPRTSPTTATSAVVPNYPSSVETTSIPAKSEATRASTLVTSRRVSAHYYGNSTTTLPASLHTSTLYSTRVYTVTSCAAPVVNCPASWVKEYVVTEVVDLYTTVCPVTATPTASGVATTNAVPPRKITITNGNTLSPCPTPIVGTFEPPVDAKPPVEHTTTIYVHITTTAVAKKTTSVSVSHAQASETTIHGGTVTVPAATSPEGPFTPSSSTPVQVTAGASGRQSAGFVVGSVSVLIACLLAM